MKKILVGLVALSSGVAAWAEDLPADYTRYEWIQSDDENEQWIDSGYAPNADTVIRASFRLLARSEGWASILGAFSRNDSSSYGVVLRYYNASQVLNGLFCNNSYGEAQISCAADRDYVAVLKSGSLTIGETAKTITTIPGNFTKHPFSATIFLFGECNTDNSGNHVSRRLQKTRLYGVTMSENETLMRDFRPCANAAGEFGLWDAVEGRFYGNQGTKGDFTAGGLAYAKDAATGELVVKAGGTLTAEALAGVTALVQESTVETLEAGAVSSLNALTVKGGAFSLRDDKAATCAVRDAVTLAGGTELRLDVTEDGSDAITAGTLVLEDLVSPERPVTVAVRGVGTMAVGAARRIRISRT